MVTKQELKNMFRTGAIPTGENFAAFIDAFVAYIDGKSPDATGNIYTDYKVISPLRADIPPSEYPTGLSEFIVNYDPANIADYIATHPSMVQLKAGKLCVRTLIEEETAYQQVFNIKDGVFEAAFVRMGADDFEDWEELVVVGGHEGLTAQQVEYMMDTERRNSIASPTALGHVMIDNDTIVIDEDGVISSTVEGVDAQTVADMITAERESVKATNTTLGHVKVDNDTITIDSNGVISAHVDVDVPIRYDDTIVPSTDPDDFLPGVTYTRFMSNVSSVNKNAWLTEINSKFSWECRYFELGLDITSVKYGARVTQNVDIYIITQSSPNKFEKVAKMYRVTEDTAFESFHTEQLIRSGSETISNILGPVGLYGNLYLKKDDGHMYINSWASRTTPGTSGWVKLASEGSIEIVNDLDSTDHTKALSARAGAELKGITDDLTDAILDIDDELETHHARFATHEYFGHVAVDGVTIISDFGVISAVGGGGSTPVVDNYNSTSKTSALSADAGRRFHGEFIEHREWIADHELPGHVVVPKEHEDNEDAVLNAALGNALREDLDDHTILKASTTVEGHVTVDGATIIAQNGTIKIKPKMFTMTSNLSAHILAAYDDLNVIFGPPETGNIAMNTARDGFYLEQGRTYRVTVSFKYTPDSAGRFSMSFVDSSDNAQPAGHSMLYPYVDPFGGTRDPRNFETIFTAPSNGYYFLNTKQGPNGTSFAMGDIQIIIQEI